MSDTEPVSIRILDREYTVGVGIEERKGLIAAAQLLDAHMREIRGSNRMASIDRIAVLAALNLAHELQQLHEKHADRERTLLTTLDTLQQRLKNAMDTSH
ncbi:cell division protein ZapA [Xylella fastidiosa]|uniref:cell division protein ZapA n=1 Tax=Xylella fastidiosa TaxID=2371 RepID=UPI000765DBE2|nr:cell division protein ZapA [Xylella fastidiosa]ALR02446.1 cell division ZapA family protein [Xylella fastidiosa]KXB14609.1 cell division ZapA family protein [Xylella fastidiosa]KXB19893.1 cell division ZapA family protein [Xylella fastidiosa]MDG5824120.1 cell division protein ZapA [Xylella fastidiosa subsp. pauca]MDG5824602.1 cell division protein ZapA [Xylella fastidiosa subsp. pauca]